jgi:hypothetical protein
VTLDCHLVDCHLVDCHLVARYLVARYLVDWGQEGGEVVALPA